MFRTFILGAAVSVSATVAMAPTEASAQSRYRDGYYSRYDGYRGYRDGRDGYTVIATAGVIATGYRSRYRPRSSINVYLRRLSVLGYGYGYGYPSYGYDYGYSAAAIIRATAIMAGPTRAVITAAAPIAAAAARPARSSAAPPAR